MQRRILNDSAGAMTPTPTEVHAVWTSKKILYPKVFGPLFAQIKAQYKKNGEPVYVDIAGTEFPPGIQSLILLALERYFGAQCPREYKAAKKAFREEFKGMKWRNLYVAKREDEDAPL